MEPAVFLDRDNTLIVNDEDLGDPAAVQLIPGVAEGLLRLHRAGYRLVVVTNQGGVARGRYTEDAVDAVHQRIVRLLAEVTGGRDLIDRFYYCPYHPEAELDAYRREHFWRKPNPGMLMQAARDMKLSLAGSWMIGDQARDIAAGRAAGCRTILVQSPDRAAGIEPAPDAIAATFAEAVGIILAQRTPGVPVEDTGRARDADSRGSAAGPPPGAQGPARTPGFRSDRSAIAVPAASGSAVHARDLGIDPAGADDGHAGSGTGIDTRPAARNGTSAVPSIERSRSGDAELIRAVRELTEELRARRVHRFEFTAPRLGAGLLLLLAILLAVLGVLQQGAVDAMLPWMLGALFVQGTAGLLLLLDGRG